MIISEQTYFGLIGCTPGTCIIMIIVLWDPWHKLWIDNLRLHRRCRLRHLRSCMHFVRFLCRLIMTLVLTLKPMTSIVVWEHFIPRLAHISDLMTSWHGHTFCIMCMPFGNTVTSGFQHSRTNQNHWNEKVVNLIRFGLVKWMHPVTT